jgi:23S rRNA pseudouridine1911/1915/1917 synthase
MIVAKNDKAHELLSNALAGKEIKRFYKALVWGVPNKSHSGDEGERDLWIPDQARDDRYEIRTNIDRSKSNRMRRAVCRAPKGKLAVTYYRLLEDFGFMSLVECELKTGRTHQIRVHMSHIGHSVVGDQVYGSNAKKILNHTSGALKEALDSFTRQALHSYKLEFTHPINGEELSFEAPLPPDLEVIMGLLM